MDYTALAFLTHLYQNVDVFLVVFVRIMGFFIILPVLSGQNLPVQARLMLCLGIALLAFVSNSVYIPADIDFTFASFALFMLTEFLVGFILGLVVMMIFAMFHFLGQLVDFSMAFGMVNVLDPFGGQQLPVTGNLYFLIISVMFITTDALRMVVWGLFESFSIIGLGQGNILGNPGLAFHIIELMLEFFRLGFHIALPMIGTLMAIDIVLGIMVKAVPQMNVFVLGMPIKVLVGLFLLYTLMPTLTGVFNIVMDDVVQYLVQMIWWMAPGGGYDFEYLQY